MRLDKSGKSLFFHKHNSFVSGELNVGETVVCDVILRRERGKEEAVNIRRVPTPSEDAGSSKATACPHGVVVLAGGEEPPRKQKCHRPRSIQIHMQNLELKPEWKS